MYILSKYIHGAYFFTLGDFQHTLFHVYHTEKNKKSNFSILLMHIHSLECRIFERNTSKHDKIKQ